jgi:hypothetical protein
MRSKVSVNRATNLAKPLLYKSSLISAPLVMDFENPIAIILGVFFLIVVSRLVVSSFSQEARLERRRRKNNARIISRAGRPSIKLSVKTKPRIDSQQDRRSKEGFVRQRD